MKWRNQSMGRFYEANESTVVYFDTLSGDTHLLSDFAAYIMQQIGDQPLTTAELMNRVSSGIDALDVADVNEAISSVLEELASLELLKLD